MTISREGLLRLVLSWQETGDPEAGILLDALEEFGIDVDQPLSQVTSEGTLSLRWHLTNRFCLRDADSRRCCNGHKYLIKLLRA